MLRSNITPPTSPFVVAKKTWDIMRSPTIGVTMYPMTKTDIAKSAVSMIVSLNATKVVTQQVAQHTTLDTETIPVKVGAMVAGNLVASSLRPATDRIVDTVIHRAVLIRLKYKLN